MEKAVEVQGKPLPPVTIVIEWENAIDVEDEWTFRSMRALETELAAVKDLVAEKPRVLYLYDQNRVPPNLIRDVVARVAPKIAELATLELLPTPGLTYYKLKNYGVSLAKTEFVIMLDSDAAPQPGWMKGLLAPFEDPQVMAVGGFTVLGYEDLLSRVLALIWIFHLRKDRSVTTKRFKINANNCAFRTAFFQANPWPDLPAFKKQCGFWLRDIDKRGIKWVRTVEAMTVHAPHPGVGFFLWRAWISGSDRDFQAYHAGYRSRLARLGYATFFWAKKCVRSAHRILTRGHEVELPVWQMPAALALAFLYFEVFFWSEAIAALTKSYPPLEQCWRDPSALPSVAAYQAPAESAA